jgi:hypothetical protein
MTVFDFVGRPIAVGCRVVYPKRRGSKMWLSILRVKNILRNGDVVTLTGYDHRGQHTRTKNINNCIVVEAAK